MTKPHDSLAYDDAIRHAVYRAESSDIHHSFIVYMRGAKMFVRASDEPLANAKVVCIAQRWDDSTVQLRFAGAQSEFIKV